VADNAKSPKPAKSNGLTKMDAVKKAMDKLGPQAKPLEIKDYVLNHFRIEISGDVANSYKKEWNRRARKAAGAAQPAAKPQAAAARPQVGKSTANGSPREERKPEPAAKPPASAPKAQSQAPKRQATAPRAPVAMAAPRATADKGTAAAVPLQDIATAKELLQRVGAERLRALIELLAE